MLRKPIQAGLAPVWATQLTLPGAQAPLAQASGVKAVGTPQGSHLLGPKDGILADHTDWHIVCS